jgi:hypothetical protein
MDIDMEQIDTRTVVKEEQHQYDFVEQIERAYDWNAARLTEMILKESQLVNRLRSLNHYFFFDRGDFFSHFIDGCDDSVGKPISIDGESHVQFKQLNLLEQLTQEVKI